jgi:hypothetical protein
MRSFTVESFPCGERLHGVLISRFADALVRGRLAAVYELSSALGMAYTKTRATVGLKSHDWAIQAGYAGPKRSSSEARSTQHLPSAGTSLRDASISSWFGQPHEIPRTAALRRGRCISSGGALSLARRCARCLADVPPDRGGGW